MSTKGAIDIGVKVDAKVGKAVAAECCALVIGMTRKGVPKGAASEVDKAMGGALSRIVSGVDAGPEPGKTHLVFAKHMPIGPERVLLVGIGGAKGASGLDKVRFGYAAAASTAEDLGLKHIVAVLPPNGSADLAQAMVEGFVLGAYRWDRFRGSKRKGASTFTVLAQNANDLKRATRGASAGRVLSESVWLARDLVNTPGGQLPPRALADVAVRMAKAYGFECRVLGKRDIERAGMVGLLAVSKGSVEEPRFIELEYVGRRGGKGKGRGGRPVVLVGKAVTFDSGGISLKPAANMLQMKYDMSGGAIMLATITAVARLGLPVHVVGLIPSTENLPDGRAYKPGDVVAYRNGRTVEVISTDAEGRLILADALLWAKDLNPEYVVDIATLTGGVKVALAKVAAAVLGNDDGLVRRLLRAGEAAGERLWQLPLWPEYHELIKGDTADIKNSGGKEGSTITASAFLENFVEYPWAHIDIAGMGWTETSKGYHHKGATAFGVRLLVQWLRTAKGG